MENSPQPKPRLSKELLKRSFATLIPPGKKKAMIFDSQERGLHAEIRHNNATYAYKGKDRNGRTLYKKIGRSEDITLDQARQKAREIRARITLEGYNPREEREQRKNALTFEAYCETRFLPHQKARKKSYAEDYRICRKMLFPQWGRRPLADIRTVDIARVHDGLIGRGLKPASANRALAAVKRAFSLAVLWDLIPKNPAVAVRKFPENNQKERYLTDEEIGRLKHAIDTEPDVIGGSAILLLLTTGARRGEALEAKWEHIDLVNRVWMIPSPKSGRRVHKPINKAAFAVLERMQSLRQNAYVFPGNRKNTHRKSLTGVWDKLCRASGISGARVHDLRHTYSSLLVRAGVSLYAVQKLLNHSTPVMTQRYSHLAPELLASESDKAAQAITGAIYVEPTGPTSTPYPETHQQKETPNASTELE